MFALERPAKIIVALRRRTLAPLEIEQMEITTLEIFSDYV